nr:hypothetical protein [Tanacetum cinerariifolium]
EKLHKALQAICEKLNQQEQAANVSTHTPKPSRRFNFIYNDDDDDEESTNPLNEIVLQIPPSIAITPVLSIMEPGDSLIMGDEDLNTILEKETDEFIKSSVEEFVPIPSESEDTSGSDSVCDLPSCNDFSPINVSEGKSVTFSNPFFDSSDDFTSSDDESLSDDDVSEANFKIYSNPLFEFDDEYISSYVNPLFDEVLENIKNKGFYLDEPDLLVTPFSDANEDECFDSGGDIEEIDAIDIPSDINDGYYDSEGDVLYLESLLSDDTTTNLPPEMFLDRDPKSLSDLKNMVKVWYPGIHEKNFFSNILNCRFLLSSGSEDTIFDPDISASHFSLEPIASHQCGTFMCFNVCLNILNESSMEICSSTHFNLNITMIWGVLSLCDEARLFLSRVLCFVFYVQDCTDFEDSHARGFVHRLLKL